MHLYGCKNVNIQHADHTHYLLNGTSSGLEKESLRLLDNCVGQDLVTYGSVCWSHQLLLWKICTADNSRNTNDHRWVLATVAWRVKSWPLDPQKVNFSHFLKLRFSGAIITSYIECPRTFPKKTTNEAKYPVELRPEIYTMKLWHLFHQGCSNNNGKRASTVSEAVRLNSKIKKSYTFPWLFVVNMIRLTRL